MDEEALRTAFLAFDSDGNGTLDPSEAIAILTRPGTGTTLSLADAEALIAEFDSDGDGKMSIGEFIAQAKYAAAAAATSPYLDAAVAFYMAACEVVGSSGGGDRFQTICNAFLQAEKEAGIGEGAAFEAKFLAASAEDSASEVAEKAAALYQCLCECLGASNVARSTHARISLDQLAAATVEGLKGVHEDIEEKLDVETFKAEFINQMRPTCKELGINLGVTVDRI